MGSLTSFDLEMIRRRYGCRVLVETGTGGGDSLAFAAGFAFDRLVSVEIHPVVAQAARERFADQRRVEIVNAGSEDALNRILPTVPTDQPVLFWLDAHFPGADAKLAGYKDEPDDDVRLPLERELTAIHALRPLGRDVILIDDLRIYEDGPFGEGNMPDFAQTLPPERRNVDFVDRLFGGTHSILRRHAHEGYLMILPKLNPAG